MKSSKILQTKKCKGCGSWLTNEINQLGYTPKNYIEVDLCQACYQLKHYQKPFSTHQTCTKWQQEISEGFNLNTDSQLSRFLTVLVTDIYNLGFFKKINAYSIGKNLLICINKIEFLGFQQKAILCQLWMQKLKKTYPKAEICCISSKKKLGIRNLIKKMSSYKEVCFIGNSGVGKSQLINLICAKLSHESANTVGSYLNTTKAIIKTTLKDLKILDTPGSIRNSGIFQYLEPAKIKQLQKSKWKKKVFQVQTKRVYYFENFLAVQLESSTEELLKASLSFDGPQVLAIRHKKLENFNFEELSRFSNINSNNSFVDFVSQKFFIQQNSFFIIDDLGWIKINTQSPIIVTVHLPKNISLVYQNELISSNDEKIFVNNKSKPI